MTHAPAAGWEAAAELPAATGNAFAVFRGTCLIAGHSVTAEFLIPSCPLLFCQQPRALSSFSPCAAGTESHLGPTEVGR